MEHIDRLAEEATLGSTASKTQLKQGGFSSGSLRTTVSKKEDRPPEKPPVTRDSLGRKTYEKTWLLGEGMEMYQETMRKQEERDRRAALRFASTLASIEDGIARQDGVNAEVDRIVRSAQDNKERKKCATYNEWQTEVFEKIQSQVEAHVESLDVHDLEKSLLARSNAYCKTAGTRGVFREVIDRATYDPYANATGTFKVVTSGLRDPLDRDLRKDAYERSLLRSAGCSYPLELPPVPPGTRRLPPPTWGAATFSETLHGRNYNTHGEVEMRHPHPTMAPKVQSLQGTVVIDHYQFPRDSAATAPDFPPGGKAPVASMNAKIHADAVGAILKLGDKVIVPSKDTFNNDAWLDWRGKGQVDSAPGSVRPRNMFEVVSMRDDNGSRPVVRGSGMDQWMESRGKKMTPAPNAGDPRELFEVLAYRSSQDIEVRDAWLTNRGRRPGPQHATNGMLYLEKPTPAQRVPGAVAFAPAAAPPAPAPLAGVAE